MTDSIGSISGVQQTGKRGSRSEVFKRGTGGHHREEHDDDSVDISEEARQRAAQSDTYDRNAKSTNG